MIRGKRGEERGHGERGWRTENILEIAFVTAGKSAWHI